MLYFSHPSSLDHDPRPHLPGHPENPERLRAIEAHLGERDWLGWERREAPAATVAELELIHDSVHVERIRRLCAAGGGAIDVDTAVVPASYKAALHAAGGTCEMVRQLLGGAKVGFTACRPPGHHAEPDRALGFCLFDSIAIAAELAIRELGAERVFILDWDVHHGNGTEAAFRERADVLFASIHQGGIFPGTGPASETGVGAGAGFTINRPVPGGSGEETWLPLLEDELLPAGRDFRPDLILISAGFDAHAADPLAGCLLTTDSFATMAARTRDLAHSLGVPIGAVLEGGYEPTALAESVAATMDALAE
ncbi:MAG TPA: histone deacetylase [Solirubrobacterales bacterium]|nr:histone deacetylase [Solirubrobacterales bacterium]